MDGNIAEIITTFASYLTEAIKTIMSFLQPFLENLKKDEKKDEA